MDIASLPVTVPRPPSNSSPCLHSPSLPVAPLIPFLDENGVGGAAPSSVHHRDVNAIPSGNSPAPPNTGVRRAPPVVEGGGGGGDKVEGAPRPKYGSPSHNSRVHVGMRLNNWVVVGWIGAGSFGETFSAISMKDLPSYLAPLGEASALPPLPAASSDSPSAPSPTAPTPEEIKKWLACLPLASERTEYCMKVEQESKKSVLRLESLALKRAQNCTQVARYIGSGYTGGLHFLVMEKLGPDLGKLRRLAPDGKFNIYTMLRAGISCLAAIRQVHEQGMVHRDIKPSNFVIGRQGTPECRVCYLIDFGLARRFRRPNGELRTAREAPGFHGTSRYASIASHKHKELGRVDDLWSLLFMLIEFATGSLPWRKCKTKEELAACKERSVKPKLVHNLPREFHLFLSHLQDLKFEDEPDYALLSSCLYRAIERRGYPEDKPVDWELFPSFGNEEDKVGDGRREKESVNNVVGAIPVGEEEDRVNEEEERRRQKAKVFAHYHPSRGGEKENGNNEENHRIGDRDADLQKNAYRPEMAIEGPPRISVTLSLHACGPEGEAVTDDNRERIQDKAIESNAVKDQLLQGDGDGRHHPAKNMSYPVGKPLISGGSEKGLLLPAPQESRVYHLDSSGPYRSPSGLHQENSPDKERKKRYGEEGSTLRGADSEQKIKMGDGDHHHDHDSDDNNDHLLQAQFSPFERQSSTLYHMVAHNSGGSSTPRGGGGGRRHRAGKGSQRSHENQSHYDGNIMDRGELHRPHGRHSHRVEGMDSYALRVGPPSYYGERRLEGRGNNSLLDCIAAKKKNGEEEENVDEPLPLGEEREGEIFFSSNGEGIYGTSGLVAVRNPNKGKERRSDEQSGVSLSSQNQQNGLTSMPLPLPSRNSAAESLSTKQKRKNSASRNCLCLVN